MYSSLKDIFDYCTKIADDVSTKNVCVYEEGKEEEEGVLKGKTI
jgi:hypothetical protein